MIRLSIHNKDNIFKKVQKPIFKHNNMISKKYKIFFSYFWRVLMFSIMRDYDIHLARLTIDKNLDICFLERRNAYIHFGKIILGEFSNC